jgi:2-polyprenyl-3-methyl-5-hydroxy-6-metoxy-1,4-benzoquinol methylase
VKETRRITPAFETGERMPGHESDERRDRKHQHEPAQPFPPPPGHRDFGLCADRVFHYSRSMFLSRRATQAEYFDSRDVPQSEIVEFYSSLARCNRLFAFADPFQRLMPRFLGADRCQSLSLLDLGAGDGSLGSQLTQWASRRGWEWRFTNLDLCLPALRLGKGGRKVAASVLALPFAEESFDVVIASQVTHHLTGDTEVVQHLREAWRAARHGIFFSDLHRGPILYGMLWLLFRLRRNPTRFHDDGLLSVKRGFRVGELRRLAEAAGLSGGRVRLHYGARVILEARKSF